MSPIDPPPGADRAINVVRGELAELLDGHRSVGVRWSGSVMINPDGERVDGWANGCQNIWVHWDGEEPLSVTALAHELTHCYARDIGQGCGGGDGSHSDPYVWGESGVLAYVTERLRLSGF